MTDPNPKSNDQNNITKKNKGVNDALRQKITQEMFLELEETFALARDPVTGHIPSSKLPVVLLALGMEISEPEGVQIPLEIDFDKLIEIVIACMKKPNWAANEMNETFAIFDKDSSGYLDPFELRRVFTRLGENLLDLELEDQLREVDIDGDLQMAVAEYYNMVSLTKGSDYVFEDSLY